MQMQDKLEKEKADAKNAVEEYVYEMRDKVYTSLEQYVNEDVSVSIFQMTFDVPPEFQTRLKLRGSRILYSTSNF